MSLLEHSLELSKQYLLSQDILKQLHQVYGGEAVEVLRALKTPGLEYSVRVNTLKADPEHICAGLVERGLKAHLHPVLEEAILIPIEGPLPIPSFSVRVIADRYAAEAVLRGSHLYASGVQNCRGLKRGVETLVTDRYGQVVCGGIAKMSETEILTLRRGLAVEITHPRYRIPSFRESSEFEEGYLYPQSLPAMVASRVLDPHPSETVLDLNCAPGGKLSHLSQLMENTGLIIGVDRSAPKIEVTRQTLSRLGCRNIRLVKSDSRYLDVDHPSIVADRCLVDPPCSALGLMPKLYDPTMQAEIAALAEYQKQFLKVAAKMVKPGGRIVYSVCTLTLEECEEVVRFAVEDCSLKVEEPSLRLGSSGLGWVIPEAVFTQRFHPHIHGCGYFIAALRKP